MSRNREVTRRSLLKRTAALTTGAIATYDRRDSIAAHCSFVGPGQSRRCRPERAHHDGLHRHRRPGDRQHEGIP